MFTKETISQMLKAVIADVSGWDSVGLDESLISKDSRIMPVDFLYIFDQIEKKMNIPVCKIFESKSHEVMTINNLSEDFFNMQELEIR